MLEQLARHDHRVVGTLSLLPSSIITLITCDVQVEESIVEGWSQRVVVVPLSLTTGCTPVYLATVVELLLLLPVCVLLLNLMMMRLLRSDGLLAAIAWRFLLTSLEVEAQVGRWTITG